MQQRIRTLAMVLGLALATASGCAGAPAAIRPSSPFTPAMAQLFDDSVDYVADVSGLGGRVAHDWERQIDGLSHNSDLIATVAVETVVQGTDADGSRSYRLMAHINDNVHGSAPDDGRVPLRVSEGQTGFNTVLGKEARLQASRYVLFVKWYSDATGTLRAHWHLSPLSDALLARVRRESGADAQERGAERVVHQEGRQTPVLEPAPPPSSAPSSGGTAP